MPNSSRHNIVGPAAVRMTIAHSVSRYQHLVKKADRCINTTMHYSIFVSTVSDILSTFAMDPGNIRETRRTSTNEAEMSDPLEVSEVLTDMLPAPGEISQRTTSVLPSTR